MGTSLQFLSPADPQPRGAGDTGVDPRGRRTGVCAGACLRSCVRQPRPRGGLRDRRRRAGPGRSRPLALQQVPRPARDGVVFPRSFPRVGRWASRGGWRRAATVSSPATSGRVSLAAVLDGRSVEHHHGFHAARRAGHGHAQRVGGSSSLIAWLEEYEGLAPHEVADALEHRSGLLGLAGTADMRELLEPDTDIERSWCRHPRWCSCPGHRLPGGSPRDSPPVSGESAPWPRVAGRDDFTTIGITNSGRCALPLPYPRRAGSAHARGDSTSLDRRSHRDVLWNAAAGLDPVRAPAAGDRGGDRCGPAPQHPAARPPHHRHGRCRRSGRPSREPCGPRPCARR